MEIKISISDEFAEKCAVIAGYQAVLKNDTGGTAPNPVTAGQYLQNLFMSQAKELVVRSLLQDAEKVAATIVS